MKYLRSVVAARTRRSSGSVLVIVMATLLGVAAIGSGLLNLGGVNAVETTRAVLAIQAFWTAEAGLAAALVTVNKLATPLETTAFYGNNALSGQTTAGTFTVNVGPAPGWSNVGAKIKKYVITSTGIAHSGFRRRVQSAISYVPALGLFGGLGVSLSGNTDIAGDVQSNQGISISGSATVHGDATPGPGKTVNNPGAVTGATAPASSAVALDPIDPEALAAAVAGNANATLPNAYFNNATRDLSIGGSASFTMAGGVYYLNSISISGSAAIRTSGPVTIYLTGAINVGGSGVMNQSGVPKDLRIYATGTSPISISGSAKFHGLIYAPGNVSLSLSGSGGFAGTAVTGGAISLSGSSGYVFGVQDQTWSVSSKVWSQIPGGT